jgi:lysophosphatidylcholine acyltransferase/lyso-PAF acetyltransferase
MEIHYLDIYVPNEEEKKDPTLFAKNVRNVIATTLGIPTTDHCFDDVLLQVEVRPTRV